MPPTAIPLIAQARDLIAHPGLLQAAGITLAAARPIRAAAAALSRKRLAWRALLDMPIALAPAQPHPGTDTTTAILITDLPGPSPAGTQDAWLVLLAITNTGLSPIRSQDFTTPLAFTFPGRQVRAAQIHPRPAHNTHGARRLHRTGTTAPAARAQPGSTPAHIELTGPYLLKRHDELTLMVILTGTPAATPLHLEGSLPGGRITAKPPDPTSRPAPARHRARRRRLPGRGAGHRPGMGVAGRATRAHPGRLTLITVIGLTATAAWGQRYRLAARAGAAGCIAITVLAIVMIIGVALATPAVTWITAGAMAASAARIAFNAVTVRPY